MNTAISFVGVGPQPLRDASFDRETKKFILRAGINSEYWCKVGFGWNGSDDPLGVAMVGLFRNSKHFESDVRRVRIETIGDKTVGWLSTLKALTSDQHEFSDDPHFRRAAFSAANSLLNEGRFTKVPSVSNEAEVDLSDFFDDELSLLILHRPSIGSSVSSSFAELLPSLYQYGFTPAGDQYGLKIECGRVAGTSFANAGKTIRLKGVASGIRFVPFAVDVFRELLPSAPTPLLRFFIFYQLVEALMGQIFAVRQSETIGRMVPLRENPVRLHPLIEKLREDASEKKRLRLLFNEFSGIEHRTDDLRSACNAFLTCCAHDAMSTTAEALYGVRNVVFHDFRAVPAQAAPLLAEVVEQLEYVVPELLNAYRVPSPPQGVVEVVP